MTRQETPHGRPSGRHGRVQGRWSETNRMLSITSFCTLCRPSRREGGRAGPCDDEEVRRYLAIELDRAVIVPTPIFPRAYSSVLMMPTKPSLSFGMSFCDFSETGTSFPKSASTYSCLGAIQVSAFTITPRSIPATPKPQGPSRLSWPRSESLGIGQPEA